MGFTGVITTVGGTLGGAIADYWTYSHGTRSGGVGWSIGTVTAYADSVTATGLYNGIYAWNLECQVLYSA